MAVVFEEVESGHCTDSFTQELLLSRLVPVKWIEIILYWTIRAVCLLGVVRYLQNIVIVPNRSYGIITKTVRRTIFSFPFVLLRRRSLRFKQH